MTYHRYQLPVNYDFANTIHKGHEQTADRVITSINKDVCTSNTLNNIFFVSVFEIFESGMACNI